MYIKTLSGDIIEIDLKLCNTVRDVKDNIYIMKRIPINQQRLVMDGMRLESENTVMEYDLRQDSTVFLINTLSGGQLYKRRRQNTNRNTATGRFTKKARIIGNNFASARSSFIAGSSFATALGPRRIVRRSNNQRPRNKIELEMTAAFEKSRSQNYQDLHVTSLNSEPGNSRSEPFLATGIITPNEVPVFIKYSPCVHNGDVTYGNDARKSPTFSELRMYSMTNNFRDLQICNAFVYGLNDSLLMNNRTYASNLIMQKGAMYSMLIMEPLDASYQTLHETIKRSKLSDTDVKIIFFQILYAIQCMASVNMAHMDLHFGNIYVKKRKELLGKYDQYTYPDSAGVFHTAYIPAHYEVKIIDLDGAHKLGVASNSNVKQIFKRSIPNSNTPTAQAVDKTNPRVNVIKVAMGLIELQHYIQNSYAKWYEMITNEDGRYPWKRGSNGHLRIHNKNLFYKNTDTFARDFGVFVNKSRKMMPLTNKHVLQPSDIVTQIGKEFQYKPSTSLIYDKVSQRRIYMR